MHAAAGLRAAMLVVALLFALRPAVTAAQEAAPAPSVPAENGSSARMTHGQATMLALGVGGLVVGTAVATAYYGPVAGAAVAAFFAAHLTLELALLGSGVGAAYALWPWGAEPTPSPSGAGATTPSGGGTSL